MALKQDVLSLIEKKYSTLSPSAQKIANYLQQNPLAIVSQSSAEIGDNTATSKATVSRFFRQLGYDTHQDAKQSQLALRESGVPLFTQGASLDQTDQEMKNLALTFEGLNSDTVNRVSQSLANASRVTLIGFRNAYPLAVHFRQQLQQVRHKVRLLPQPGQTLGEDLHDLVDDEVVVLLGFRRRTRQFKDIVDALKGCRTVLITDPTGQMYNQKVSDLFVCHLGNESPFDSYAAPMSLISMLCNRVFTYLGDDALHQIQEISALYESLDELEP